MPFANHGSLVTILLEKLRESQLVAIEGGRVVDEPVGMTVLAGEHAGTARSADGIGHEAIGESYTFIADTVDVRGMDVPLVIRTDGLIRMVITHDIDDVHFFGSFRFLVGLARRKGGNGCRSGEGVKQGRRYFIHKKIMLIRFITKIVLFL
jgi:hypothetical protein